MGAVRVEPIYSPDTTDDPPMEQAIFVAGLPWRTAAG